MKSTERFSDRVALYVKYRPHYPAQLLDFMRDTLGLSPASVIADIGSGTGNLSRLFLEAGNEVYGVEPNTEMRQAAEELVGDYRNFYSITGTAEATTLPDHTFDFVTAGQAFHWFDQQQAKKEFNRILKPGGRAVLIWNMQRETEPVVEACTALMQRYGIDYSTLKHKALVAEYFAQFFAPHTPQIHTFDNFQVFDFEQLKGRMLSSSYAPLPSHPNHQPLLEGLQAVFEQHQQHGQVTYAYDTKVLFA